MAKKYVLKPTAEGRVELQRVVRKGRVAGWKVQRAQAPLRCDQGPDGPAWTDETIAAAYGVTTRSLESWRKQAVERGPLSLLERKPRVTPAVTPELDGEERARLTALACSKAPDGQARRSSRLLAERLVELEVVASISYEAVRRALKKARRSPGSSGCGASRRSRMPPSSAGWSRSWRSTSGPTTRGGRSSAWMSSPSD